MVERADINERRISNLQTLEVYLDPQGYSDNIAIAAYRLNPESTQITKPEDPVPNDEDSRILICDVRYADTQNASSAFKVQMHIEN